MARKAKTKANFAELRENLLEEAKKSGLTEDYNFMTTFDRYCHQVELISKLAAVIEK